MNIDCLLSELVSRVVQHTKPTRSFLTALLFAIFWIASITSDAAKNSPMPGTPERKLGDWLKVRFFAMTSARNAAFEKLNGQTDLRRCQEEHRSFLLRQIGAFPQRASLNARVVGQL